MAFVEFTDFVEKGVLILEYFLQDLDLSLANDLLLRNHVEVVEMAEVETELTAFLQPLQQIVLVQVRVEHDVVAQLRNLSQGWTT